MPSAIGTIKMPAIKECSNTKVGPNIKYTRVNERTETRNGERVYTRDDKRAYARVDICVDSGNWDPGGDQ